jgi:hypothetical protein
MCHPNITQTPLQHLLRVGRPKLKGNQISTYINRLRRRPMAAIPVQLEGHQLNQVQPLVFKFNIVCGISTSIQEYTPKLGPRGDEFKRGRDALRACKRRLLYLAAQRSCCRMSRICLQVPASCPTIWRRVLRAGFAEL